MGNDSSEFAGVTVESGLDEALWSMVQRSRVFEELRRDICHVWNDEAAHDVENRYLKQHAEEDSRMRTALQEQRELLEEARQTLISAVALSQKIDECSAIVTEKSHFAVQDLDNAYSDFDQYVHHNSEAGARFPQVEDLIAHANAAC
jgi:hypothetical protein